MAMSDISSNAMEVLKRRYLAKDENGKPVETVEQMFRHIVDFCADQPQAGTAG